MENYQKDILKLIDKEPNEDFFRSLRNRNPMDRFEESLIELKKILKQKVMGR